MKRVTNPKGTVAAAVWDYGEGMETLRAFWDEAMALAPARRKGRAPHAALPPRRSRGVSREHRLQDVVEGGVTVETQFCVIRRLLDAVSREAGLHAYTASLLSRRIPEALRLRLRRRLLVLVRTRCWSAAPAWAVRGTIP